MPFSVEILKEIVITINMKESDLDRILDESLSELYTETLTQPNYDELLSCEEFAFFAMLTVMLCQFERKCKT